MVTGLMNIRTYLFIVLLMLSILISLSFAITSTTEPAPMVSSQEQEVSVNVLREAYEWKFSEQEKVGFVFFSCKEINCPRIMNEYKVPIYRGIYKAYFPDGFVLTLADVSGKVIESYYFVESVKEKEILKDNLKQYALNTNYYLRLSSKQKQRIHYMRIYSDPFYRALNHTENNDLEKAFNEIYVTLNKGKLIEIEKNNPEIPYKISYEVSNDEIPRYYGLRSLFYFIKGQTEEAQKDAQMAYNLNPNDTWAKSAMAYVNVKEGKYRDALVLVSDSKEPLNKLIEAIAYAKSGDFKKSAEVYATIPQDYLTTKNTFRRYFISQAQEALSPYIQERKLLATSYELKGQLREALNEYAPLLKISGETESKEIFRKVSNLLKRNPSLMELPEEARRHALRAEAMTGEGKFEEAIKEYKKAIEISPFTPALYKALALNYAGFKKYKEAIENIKMYLELYPDAPDARRARDEIYRWEALMEKEGK